MKRLKSIYRIVAINLLNTIVLLLILNIVLGVFFYLRDRRREQAFTGHSKLFQANGSPVDNGKRHQGNLDWFDYDATREVSEIEAAEVLDDIYHLGEVGFIYQPWSQFSEPPFRGKRVSIEQDARAFPVRKTFNPPQDSSKPIVDVFVLGGSTTFGYYVSDEHTWPSYLTKALNQKAEREGLNIQVRVTNYGHATHYPTQETALCMELFRSGHRPHLVIFMDGVNWGPAQDHPFYTRELGQAFHSAQHLNQNLAVQHTQGLLKKWLPMYRLAVSVNQRMQKESPAETLGTQQTELGEKSAVGGPNDYLQHVIQRFQQANRIGKKVCEEYGSSAMFFLQPDASYNYPVTLLRRAPVNWEARQSQRKVFYDALAENRDFISLAQAFRDYGVDQGRKAVVNGMHYSPNFNKFLAETVAAHIDLRKIASLPAAQNSPPTGVQRQIASR